MLIDEIESTNQMNGYMMSLEEKTNEKTMNYIQERNDDMSHLNWTDYNPTVSTTVIKTETSSRDLTINNAKAIEEFESRYQLSYRFETTIDLTKFELIRTLGEGSFGRVILVIFDSDKSEYALKVLDKSKIVKFKQLSHVQSELRILNAIRHPNVMLMHHTFQDTTYIYILIEYIRGGDLFGYMKKFRSFPEDITRFFAAQIVLVFEYLHFFNIVYRDLKPENILVDHRGYLKLADFGFAKRIEQRTYTLCGTPDYFSPEIIQSKGHGKPTDWWTLGVLIYELYTGTPPFRGETEVQLFEAICRKKLILLATFPMPLKSILISLLKKDPYKRLGSGARQALEIKENSWFNTIDFSILYSQQKLSPFLHNVITRTVSDFRQESLTREEKPLIVADHDYFIDEFKHF